MNYLIWSYDHNAWWRPNECGYTERIEEAGRYTASTAGRIVTSSIFLERVAIIEKVATDQGPPKFHPYDGEQPPLPKFHHYGSESEEA